MATTSMIPMKTLTDSRTNKVYEIVDEVARTGLDDKMNKSGYDPNKFLGTDADGNIILKDTPQSTNTTTTVENPYTLPTATDNILGGVKAKVKTTESVEVAVDETGKLFVPMQSGSNGSSGMTTEQSQQLSANTADVAKLKEDIVNKLDKTGHGSNKYLGTDSTGNVVEKEPPTPIVNNYTETVENPYTLPVATETVLGGIKASPKTEAETVEVKIGADGKLYVPPTQGGVLDINQIASQLEIQPSVDEAGDMTFSIVAKQTGGTV